MNGKLIILRKRILENLQQKWTVKQLAASIGMSESNIQKLFKDEFGMPPIKYIQHLRLEKAVELLKDEKFLNIQEICIEIGTNDSSRFAEVFNKKYGTTPTQYRKDYWNNYNAEN
ncbi:MAG: helix-turn-helix transcriptional regulator [Aridibacter sp.]